MCRDNSATELCGQDVRWLGLAANAQDVDLSNLNLRLCSQNRSPPEPCLLHSSLRLLPSALCFLLQVLFSSPVAHAAEYSSTNTLTQDLPTSCSSRPTPTPMTRHVSTSSTTPPSPLCCLTQTSTSSATTPTTTTATRTREEEQEEQEEMPDESGSMPISSSPGFALCYSAISSR
ncbi:hypothetical protein GGR56DRAFT_159609 [Xylariaceae sp. FL0804]|nr:hypothetical protein GGR56DRAFT_159609 [Xylariaceae sp. FL0804]